jgi:hypothetical protein
MHPQGAGSWLYYAIPILIIQDLIHGGELFFGGLIGIDRPMKNGAMPGVIESFAGSFWLINRSFAFGNNVMCLEGRDEER